MKYSTVIFNSKYLVRIYLKKSNNTRVKYIAYSFLIKSLNIHLFLYASSFNKEIDKNVI